MSRCKYQDIKSFDLKPERASCIVCTNAGRFGGDGVIFVQYNRISLPVYGSDQENATYASYTPG